MLSQKNKKIIIIIGMIISLGMVFLIFYDVVETVRLKTTFVQFSPQYIINVVSIDQIIRDFDNYYIIDVREPEEFEQGHFKGAINIPLGELLSDDNFKKNIISDADNREIIFFCHDGLRSKIAADKLSLYVDNVMFVEKGFDQMKKQKNIKDVWIGPLDVVLSDEVHEFLKSRKNIVHSIPEDVTVLDMTWNQVYSKDNDNIIQAPLMRMPKIASQTIIKNLKDKPFVVVCNSNMSCFYAKIFGYRATIAEADFVGYYVLSE